MVVDREDRPGLAVALLLDDVDRDLPTARAVLDRVRDQVRDDPLDAGLVPVAEHAAHPRLDLDHVPRADLLVLRGEAADDRDEIGRGDVEL